MPRCTYCDVSMETPIAQPDAGTADGDARRLRNGLISTVALVLLLGGIAIAVPSLHTILRPVEHAQPAWLLIALALEVGSCLGYVAVVRLVMHPLPGARGALARMGRDGVRCGGAGRRRRRTRGRRVGDARVGRPMEPDREPLRSDLPADDGSERRRPDPGGRRALGRPRSPPRRVPL